MDELLGSMCTGHDFALSSVKHKVIVDPYTQRLTVTQASSSLDLVFSQVTTRGRCTTVQNPDGD
jgi:hypothetical protein